MIDHAVDGILEVAKKKKKIKKIPTAPKIKIDTIKEVFKKEPDIMDAIQLYEMFKLIDVLKKSKTGEFRKGVCLTITYKGQEVKVDLEKLKEYSEILERFINYTKLFLTKK